MSASGKKRLSAGRHDAGEIAVAANGNKKRKKNGCHFLKGMIVAISTVQNSDTVSNSNSDSNSKAASLEEQRYSYRQVSDSCQSAGAKVSGQAHKKVHCLLCTPAAMAQQSQRVRKAIKNHVPLVHVHWLDQCLAKNQRLPFDEFLLESNNKGAGKESMGAPSNNDTGNVSVDRDDNHEAIAAEAGWSDPVDVGCCCVCHETGTTANCEYCKDCQGNDNSDHDKEPLPDTGWSSPVDVGCCCVCHETGTTADCQWCNECTIK
jgi:hypothetical protein